MYKLSAVVITKNEEERIRRCLDSLRGLAYEVVVVDDESTDRTTGIAKEDYGAKVIVNKSGGNFDRQRNLGIEAASGDWILQLDADEVVPSETAKKIKDILANNRKYSAFTLIRNDCIFEHPLNYAGRLPIVKLFKKGKAHFIGEKIHETLKIDGETGNIDARVLHYNHPSVKEVVNKWNFYTDVESDFFGRDEKACNIKVLKDRLINKTFKMFFKHYIKHRGYKDGGYGLMWSILHTLNALLLWLKVLEKCLKDERIGA